MKRISLRHAGLGGILALVLVALLLSPARASEQPARQCQEVDVPVRLDLAIPVQAHGTLCQPTGTPRPSTVQVLLHGATYNSTYWDFPVQPERYSYALAANQRGYATFNVDRVGYGDSTKVPSTLGTVTTISRNINAPTMIANGQRDPVYCGTVGEIGRISCQNARALARDEAPYFSPAAQLSTFVLPGAGHNINLVPTAPEYHAAVVRWLDAKVGAR